MNYQRIHDQIIDRAKSENRKKIKDSIYYECHHIIPRCMGGTNVKENLVLLTGREHYLIHYLLVRIYPKNNKLIYAFWIMSRCTNNREYKSSNRFYEESRRLFVETIKENQFNKKIERKKQNVKTYFNFINKVKGIQNKLGEGRDRQLTKFRKLKEQELKASTALRPKGEKHFNAKFSDKDIEKIRELYLTGNYTLSKLAEMYNSSCSTMGYFVRSKGKERYVISQNV